MGPLAAIPAGYAVATALLGGAATGATVGYLATKKTPAPVTNYITQKQEID